jgi:hypothetical protein
MPVVLNCRMTSTRHSAPDKPGVENLLSSLAGVLSAHVVRGESGRLVEIHVLTSAAFHPKQVVRNVESALRAGLGMEVDRRIISVAQVRTPGHGDPDQNGDATHAPAEGVAEDPSAGDDDGERVAARRRLEFVRYQSRRQDGRCVCQVELRDEPGQVTGSGAGPDTAAGRAEAAARAVLDAIGQARPELRLVLDGATITSSRGRTFVVAAAQLLRERGPVRLAGAAAMTRSPEEAAILATLQATNRWSG